MLRQAILLLASVGVLVSHLPAVPHLHPGATGFRSAGDSRPHLHLNQFGVAGETAPDAGHDTDAWYLADAAPADGSDGTFDIDAGPAVGRGGADHVSVGTADRSVPAATLFRTTFTRPLYVRHLSLLI